MVQTSRQAFTLTEILVAIVLLAITLTAFHAHTLLTVRQIANNSREAIAATLAYTRAEKSFAAPCDSLVPATGSDSANGVTATWSVTPTYSTTQIDIQTNYRTLYNTDRTESYHIVRGCP
jgi:prepilin-type N-terminal cleavage/methylation domain-containing protein